MANEYGRGKLNPTVSRVFQGYAQGLNKPFRRTTDALCRDIITHAVYSHMYMASISLLSKGRECQKYVYGIWETVTLNASFIMQPSPSAFPYKRHFHIFSDKLVLFRLQLNAKDSKRCDSLTC